MVLPIHQHESPSVALLNAGCIPTKKIRDRKKRACGEGECREGEPLRGIRVSGATKSMGVFALGNQAFLMNMGGILSLKLSPSSLRTEGLNRNQTMEYVDPFHSQKKLRISGCRAHLFVGCPTLLGLEAWRSASIRKGFGDVRAHGTSNIGFLILCVGVYYSLLYSKSLRLFSSRLSLKKLFFFHRH